MPSTHVTRVRGLPATTVARTLIDLARHISLVDAVIAIDAALHCQRTTRAERYIVVRWDHADLTHHAAATKQKILRAFSRADLLRRQIQPAS